MSPQWTSAGPLLWFDWAAVLRIVVSHLDRMLSGMGSESGLPERSDLFRDEISNLIPKTLHIRQYPPATK